MAKKREFGRQFGLRHTVTPSTIDVGMTDLNCPGYRGFVADDFFHRSMERVVFVVR